MTNISPKGASPTSATRGIDAYLPSPSGRSALAIAMALAMQLTACSPDVHENAYKTKLAEAEAKIQVLESELAKLKSPVQASPADTSASTPASAAAPAASATPAAEPSETSTEGLQWTYNASEEQMTGGTRKMASVTSTNTVDFGFPYAGSQNGSLTLRVDPRYGKDVIFSIERGQILCTSYNGCTVQVRFDDEKPTSFSASSAADHSSESIFLADYGRFLAKMRKAKRVRISPDIYQNGRPVFDFNVSGFNVDKYQAKKS